MLARVTRILDGLVVHPERMAANVALTRGLIYSQAVLLALTEAGLARDAAYVVVQRHAMRTWDGAGDFHDLLATDPAVREVLEPQRLAACFDPARLLRHVDDVFRRVFGADAAL
jgi:adenylosuccinate lyase